MLYKTKRPAAVQAIQVVQAVECARARWSDLPQFLIEAYNRGEVIFAPTSVMIMREQSRATAAPRDWLVCDATGQVDVVSDHLFQELFT